MGFHAKKRNSRVQTFSAWPQCDRQMRSAWAHLVSQGIAAGPFNRTQCVRAGVLSILAARDASKLKGGAA